MSYDMADPVAVNNAAKRKRPDSPSATSAAPASKSIRTTATTPHANQLQINYLARQCADDLPFISKDDTLPNLLEVLSSYNHVLDRQESLASNLGARPLGPILIKRFERCFDGPPKIIASHSHAKGISNGNDDTAPAVTWLDVVHFAQAHPAQFDLATFSEGRRVCQFYYPQKQVRVQVSEEDFLFINSGRCQDLIPPLPIWEDEEKEVGTCEILEKALRELTNAADMVAARTRQLGHRLKGRRMAIQERRTEQGLTQPEPEAQRHTTPPVPAHTGFTAMNAQRSTPAPAKVASVPENPESSAAIRSDLLKHFQSLPHNHPVVKPEPRRTSQIHSLSPAYGQAQHHATHPAGSAANVEAVPHSVNSESLGPNNQMNGHALDQLSYYIENGSTPQRSSFTPANHPSSEGAPKHNFSRPLPPSQESSQPYRALCQAHMEGLPRGSRVLPPCDRCRRLRMDCLKNLSSCAGCTKKHARCHWKDVRREEVRGLEGFEEAEMNERKHVPDETDNMHVDEYNSARHSDDDGSRRMSEDHFDQINHTNGNGTPAMTATLPPLNRSELEQHAQASMSHVQSESTQPEPLQGEATHHAPQQTVQQTQPQPSPSTSYSNPERQEKEGLAQSTHALPNAYPFPKRSEGDESHHAMDLLRLLSQEATNVAANSSLGQGARTNGAFRSIYLPSGAEQALGEHSNAAPSNENPTG